MHGPFRHPAADTAREPCHRAHVPQNPHRPRPHRLRPAAERLRFRGRRRRLADASGRIEGDITFQTWNLRANYKDYFEGLIADFEKKYPGTHVKWVDQPAEGYADKISADAAAGTLPDVVNVSPDLLAPLAKAGLATDLDKTAAQYKKEYLPGAWDGQRIPGLPGTYAFPGT